jgi:cell division protein FtsI/penicillin-binding protein 2
MFLVDWQRFKPENFFAGQTLERVPAGLSLVYLAGLGLVLFILFILLFERRKHSFIFEKELPLEVKRKANRTAINRGLVIWQIIFILLASAVFWFHLNWTIFAVANDERLQKLSNRDIRFRRAASSELRGWIFDRSGDLSNVLAYYKKQPDGSIARTYTLDREMAHLLGTEIGIPGLERTLFAQPVEKLPEAWEAFINDKKPEVKDVRLTIDKDLQVFVAKQLEGKKGAIVVLNPQTGDVLAMYSSPSFALSQIRSIEDLTKLEEDKVNKPLLNKATREYYVPGSTFKTFTMITAFRAGMEDLTFESRPEGYIPFNGSKPILDANGGCEPPYGCTELNIAQAYEVSSNQYFAQLAVALGRERLRQTARLVGIEPVDTPSEALNFRLLSDIWNTSSKPIANSLALAQSVMVLGNKISAYDLGLEGMGQGYAGQMTPFQMALIVSAIGNLQGKLMKPKIEADLQPQVFSQVLSPNQAARIREIMALVTEGSGGTATRVFANLRTQGIRVGGKTGTAEKLAPVFENGKLKTVKKRRKVRGEWIEYEVPVMYQRTDSWFVCIAPLENPRLAIAVVVEGGGFGARTAAPIAANIILKAKDLGLLGEEYKPKNKQDREKSRRK